MELHVFGLAECGEINGKHHHHPDTHEDQVRAQPAGKVRCRDGHTQPSLGVTVLDGGRNHERYQPQDVERQQETVEAIEPIPDAAERQWHRIGDADRVPDLDTPSEPGLQTGRDNGSLEHSVVESRDGQQQCRGRRSVPIE